MAFLDCFYTFMTALFSALIVVPFLRKWALDQGEVDLPDDRKMHDTPMPRLGGIAIFLSFLLAIIVYVPVTPVVRGFLAGGLIIFVTGLVDDLTDLSSRRKFTGQIAACLATILIGRIWLSDLGNLFGFGDIVLPVWIGIPFTVFAVVGVINAINLIDGLDGLAGGVSIIALTAFIVLGFIESDKQTVYLSMALAGGLLGFLKYNFYPARIFMGDAGSMTIGFVLGFLAVYTTQRPAVATSPMVPILILGLPLLDTVWVMSRRLLTGDSPFVADRTHVHHKFLDLGFEHRFTVVIIYGLSMFWACSALLMRAAPEFVLLIFLLGTALLFYLGLKYVLDNPEHFAWLQRDATSGLRSSKTFQRISAVVDQFVPLLIWILGAYLLLAFYSTVVHNYLSWQIAFLLLGTGLFLWYRPIKENRQFLMLILYFVAGMAALEVWHADRFLISELSARRVGDVLLGLGAVVVILKFQFRRNGEFFLTSADYLTLALCVFLAIASQQNALGLNLNGPLLRAVAAIFIIRTLCSRKLPHYRMTAMMCFVFLALVGLLGLIV